MIDRLQNVKEKVFLFVLFMVLKGGSIFAQSEENAYETINNKLSNAGTNVLDIITWVIGAGLAIGLANAIFKVANKKHESWDNVIGWGAGLVIFIIGMQIVKALFFDGS